MKYSLLILLGAFTSLSLYSKSMFVTKDSGLFLDIHGVVWSIDANKEQPQPMDALKDITIRQIVSSEHSTFFISKEGQVFATGYNEDGHLGLGHNGPVVTPTRVLMPLNSPITQVEIKYDRDDNGIFFLDENKEVYFTGKNFSLDKENSQPSGGGSRLYGYNAQQTKAFFSGYAV